MKEKWKQIEGYEGLYLILNGNLIKEWSSASETKFNGFDPSNVSKCCRLEKEKYKNFNWKYI